MGLGRGAGLDLATLFALFPLLYASKPFTERTTTHTIPINVDGAAMNIVFRPSIDEPYATASAACSEFHISASDCVRVAEHFISLMAPTAAASFRAPPFGAACAAGNYVSAALSFDSLHGRTMEALTVEAWVRTSMPDHTPGECRSVVTMGHESGFTLGLFGPLSAARASPDKDTNAAPPSVPVCAGWVEGISSGEVEAKLSAAAAAGNAWTAARRREGGGGGGEDDEDASYFDGTSQNWHYQGGSTPVNDGKWHHCAFTFDGATLQVRGANEYMSG